MSKKLKDLTPSQTWDLAKLLDGHTLYDSKKLAEAAGIDPEVLAPHSRTHKSGTDHKSTIYVDGRAVKELPNVVNGLSLLGSIVSIHGLKCRDFYGRGSQAREYQRAISEWAKAQ